MSSPLDNLCGANKPLALEPPDASEFAGLKRSGIASLQDASNTSLSLEGRFDLAYNDAPTSVSTDSRPGSKSRWRS